MAFRIEDGGGRGNHVKVGSTGQLNVLSEQVSIQAIASLKNGEAFQVISGPITVATAGEQGILALRNDSTSVMIVTYIRIGVDKTETGNFLGEVYKGGTWVAGTAVTPQNMNFGSLVESNVTAHKGAIPTGASLIDMFYLTGPNQMTYNKEGAVVLTPGTIISLKGTTTINGAKVFGRISYLMKSYDTINNL